MLADGAEAGLKGRTPELRPIKLAVDGGDKAHLYHHASYQDGMGRSELHPGAELERPPRNLPPLGVGLLIRQVHQGYVRQ